MLFSLQGYPYLAFSFTGDWFMKIIISAPFLPKEWGGVGNGGHPHTPAKGGEAPLGTPSRLHFGARAYAIICCYRKVKGTKVPFRRFQGVSP